MPGMTADDPRMRLVTNLLQLGAVGAGTGVAARGLLGFRNLFREPPAVPFISPGPSRMPVPVLQNKPEEPEEEADPAGIRFKLAAPGQPATPQPGTLSTLATQLKEQLAGMIPEGAFGRNAVMVPAAFMTAGSGLIGGWKATDWLLNRQRKRQIAEELEAARTDYQHALADQFHAKAASGEPAENLDTLYDDLEKRGIFDQGAVPAGAGKLMGAAILANLLVAGGAAAGTYNWAQGRSSGKLLERAQKARARQLWQQGPQPIFAVPQPVEV